MNCSVMSLAEKQKAFEQYAETAEGQRYIAQAPAPTPKQKKQVVWQITEAKMRELEWQRAQLIRYQKEQMAKAKAAKAKGANAPKASAPKLGPKGTNTPKVIQSQVPLEQQLDVDHEDAKADKTCIENAISEWRRAKCTPNIQTAQESIICQRSRFKGTTS